MAYRLLSRAQRPLEIYPRGERHQYFGYARAKEMVCLGIQKLDIGNEKRDVGNPTGNTSCRRVVWYGEMRFIKATASNAWTLGISKRPAEQ